MTGFTDWLSGNWWWLHFVLLGMLAGRSVGMWAYRDVWYALSTFLSGPSDTSGLFHLLRQWLAALVLALPGSSHRPRGLLAMWTFLEETGRDTGWWRAAGCAASTALILVATTISVLLHPGPVSHES